MDLWFTEKQTRHLGISCRVEQVLVKKRSLFQDILVMDTPAFGRMLVLDGYIQLTELDEYIYHEMIAHVPLVTHPSPRKVLIIGGGDGGAAREVLKHSMVEVVELVEIDADVLDVSRQYLPLLGGSLSSPRVTIRVEDGTKYLRDKKEEYDVIIVDSTEPVGPSEGLFSCDFYRLVFNALKKEGVMVAQTESPFYNRRIISGSFNILRGLFPVTCLYLAPVPSYPGGLWSFTLGSKHWHPGGVSSDSTPKIDGCNYYTAEIHHSCFVLPPMVKVLLEEKDKC